MIWERENYSDACLSALRPDWTGPLGRGGRVGAGSKSTKSEPVASYRRTASLDCDAQLRFSLRSRHSSSSESWPGALSQNDTMSSPRCPSQVVIAMSQHAGSE